MHLAHSDKLRQATPVWDLDPSLKGPSDIPLKTSLVSLKEGPEKSLWVIMFLQGGTLCPSETPGIWASETKLPPAGLGSWYFPLQTPKVT